MPPPAPPVDPAVGPEVVLPTLSKLGLPHLPENIDADQIASSWFSSFSKALEAANIDEVLSHLVTSSFAFNFFLSTEHVDPTSPKDIPVYWRDIFALSWDIRTFEGTNKIKRFLSSQLGPAGISKATLQTDVAPSLQRPFPDIAWIQLLFNFETKAGLCSGIIRLLPIPGKDSQELTWRAFSIFTNLEDLKGFPEKIGPLRNQEPNHGKWESARQKEVAFEDRNPTVLVIGGGQNGLTTAARLKALDISTLVIEKNQRIGDNWRTRYEPLCLHTTTHYCHLPYLPFPPTWPLFTPAMKLANWLEHYAEALELNVWMSSTVTSATQDPVTKRWSVKVQKADGSQRTFQVKYVVLAVGLIGGQPKIPAFPGMNTFKGQMLHSLRWRKATDHMGKKVVVIGSGVSAHDICTDYVNNGVGTSSIILCVFAYRSWLDLSSDVTMVQRSSTYVMSVKNGVPLLIGAIWSEDGPAVDLADRLSLSMPLLVMAGVFYRMAKIVAELDKDILDGLHNVGFRTTAGYKNCGLLLEAFTKGGGYYMDVGGSKLIIDGKIKLKNDSQIKEFVEGGIRFEDGSELEADVVIFCTGMGGMRDIVRQIFGDEVAERAPEMWGLNEEGEFKGCFREVGSQGLYNMMGDFLTARFFSKTLALQIKAIEEGVSVQRYKD